VQKADINITFSINSHEKAILEKISLALKDGDSVLTALETACGQFDIAIEKRGVGSFAYIVGIDNLREKDVEATAGWIYEVNGEMVNSGVGSKKLADGDNVEFIFSLKPDIG